MKINSLKYALVYLIPLIVVGSIYSANYFSYSALIFIFLVIPFVELFTNGSTENMTEAEESIIKKDKIYDLMLWGLVPVQYGIMVFFLFQISNEALPLLVKVGMISAFGMSCGVLGINAAHELGHRSTRHEQLMSKLLLLTSMYMHFFIEHNRGHHKNVSTDNDPASSRYNETVYAFYFRSIIGSWLSAWHLESDRLKKNKLPFWSWNNEMLQFQVIQILLLVAIALFFSPMTMLYFFASAFIGILLLETVNYIEHYGLRRKKKGEQFERTLPIHSWNSNHPIGRLLLLELSRHSDHHYIASRKYQVLRHFDESPQMPTGYPGMMLLSLIPPLWFKVMHKKIDAYKQLNIGQDLA